MDNQPTRGRYVDVTLHGVFIDDAKRDPDTHEWASPRDLHSRPPTYTVTINGVPVPDIRAFQVQLHSPEPTTPGDTDPRTEVEAHWGGDPELIIAAWEADRAALKHLAKYHEGRANELAADLDHAERDNRRLAAENKRLKGEK